MKSKKSLLTAYIMMLLALVGPACLGQAEEHAMQKSPPANLNAEPPKPGSAPEMARGKVVEVIDAGRSTYIQIDTGEKKIWVATQAFKGKPGDEVTVPPGDPVADFYSKRLKRKFDLIYFVRAVQKIGEMPPAPAAQPMPPGNPPLPGSMTHPMMHPPMESPDAELGEIGAVEKAVGGYTVHEIVSGREALAGKAVSVRGKVVKYTPGIMDKNWLHVRDGSGEKGTNDLVVTTAAEVKVGDTVLIQGTVSINRDFGHGLLYRVIIEDAAVTTE